MGPTTWKTLVPDGYVPTMPPVQPVNDCGDVLFPEQVTVPDGPNSIVYGGTNLDVSTTRIVAFGKVTALLSFVIAGPVSVYEVVDPLTAPSRRRPVEVVLPLSRP